MNEASEVAAPLTGLAGAAIGLANRNNSRAAKALSWLMVGQAAFAAGKQQYTVSVPADDDIYPELNVWLLDRLAPTDRRSLLARTSRSYQNSSPEVCEPGVDSAAKLRLFYDSSRQQTVVVGGHKIEVGLDEPSGGGDAKDDLARWFKKEKLVFTCHGEPARDAFLSVLADLVANLQVAVGPRVYIAQRWGGWSRMQDTPTRGVETVVLRDGDKETLISDVQEFLASETAYVNLGIPYHRSYLLYGPPGTGKTSVARAIAAHLKLDLRYVPLSIVENDSVLFELLSNVGSRSVLLLEDIDIAHAARERDDSAHGVTLSGLLNALDGVVTAHGLVTLMTTNNRDVLDEALIRPGRVDRQFHLGHLDDDQLHRLVTAVGGVGPLPPLDGQKVAPAAVIEVFKRHLTAPDRAVDELRSLIAAGWDTAEPQPISAQREN